MPGHGDGGHDHGGGHGGDAECQFDAPESKPFGPCQASSTYPLFCTAEVRLRRGDKRRRSDVVAAARRVLKRFSASDHTYVEVADAASPKSVITQSRRTGPMFSGISCRPCKN